MMTQAFEYLDIQWDDARAGRKIVMMVNPAQHYAESHKVSFVLIVPDVLTGCGREGHLG